MVGIYKITSPKGRVYVGQSVDIGRRYRKYETETCTLQTRLYNSILKYGFINHKFEVIEECGVDDLNARERYWQDFYEVLGKNGLNCILTTTDTLSGKRAEETVKKMSESTKGVLKGPQPLVKCPKCGKEGGVSSMHRYHFDNCEKDHSTGPVRKVQCPKCGKIGGLNTMKQYHFDNCGKKTYKPQKQVKCPYCDVVGGAVVMKRHHFHNCKKKVTKKVDL